MVSNHGKKKLYEVRKSKETGTRSFYLYKKYTGLVTTNTMCAHTKPNILITKIKNTNHMT